MRLSARRSDRLAGRHRCRSSTSATCISSWRSGSRRSPARSTPGASRHNAKSRNSCARRWQFSILSWRTAIRKLRARVPLAVVLVVWALIAFAVPQSVRAQATGEAQPDALDVSICSKPSVPHSSIPVVRDLLTEYRDLTFDFCRVWEDYKDGGFSGMLERQFGTVQDAFVDVATGRGLHPTLGLIVPESGA